MEKTALMLQREIERIKKELAGLGDLRPGSLSEQYNVCGKPGCRCKAEPPQKHGPYHQISYTRKGRSGTKFVKREHLPAVKRQMKNYERMRKLVDQWIEAGTELSNLAIEERKRG
jgi:hypothetical protein